MQFLEGSTILGTATLAGGRATLQADGLASERNAIEASYEGGGNYDATTSHSVIEVIRVPRKQPVVARAALRPVFAQ